MDSLEKRAIMRVLPQILNDLDPRHIMSDLLEFGLLHPQEVSQVNPSEVELDPTDINTHHQYQNELRDKTNQLISILVKRDDGSLLKFIHILKKDYEWLADELKHQYDEEIKTGDRLRKYSGPTSPFSSPLRPSYRNQTSITSDYQSSVEQLTSSTESRQSLEKKFYARTNSI